MEHRHLGERYWWASSDSEDEPSLLFTENDTNHERLFGSPSATPYTKDAFHRALIDGDVDAVNPDCKGTKAAARFEQTIESGGSMTVSVRFSPIRHPKPFSDFDDVFTRRKAEADEFYGALQPDHLSGDERNVQRQAFAGLMWTKQFYHYSVELWQDGDPAQPPPPEGRDRGRNADWRHLYSNDILSMPDKWEYPWFAAWDLAFHVVPIALIDPQWAKRQVVLMLREWYMHPNGAIPAYEWAMGDVNPPVHAWAAWQVYKITRDVEGEPDYTFLERCFQKLLLNFTWWVNRKDRDGHNVFQGGFLGLDNIGIFDRSAQLPTGGYLEQADGTAWMAMYCINMLAISLELARKKPAYEDIATKFFEHFVYIARAFYEGESRMWHEEDGFYYDVLRLPDHSRIPLRIRSFVGLIPLFAVGGLQPGLLEQLPHFRRRVEWFLKYRPHLIANIGSLQDLGANGFFQIAIAGKDRLQRILTRVFDETEFLGDYGLRSMSRHHADNPYELHVDGASYSVGYEPAESRTGLFGGNSNWRGPIWFPINYLMIQALRKYHLNYGDSLTVELGKGSGNHVTLDKAADELSRRLVRIFTQNEAGERPVFGGEALFNRDPHWRGHIPFFEYFHGDSGAGLGASHQTGWTALVARLLQGPDQLGLE